MQRRFIPGSEWIYFKLYTGTKTADLLLTRYIFVFVNDLIKNETIDKFFFIRYSDPDFHIRLRLHFSDLNQYGIVFSEFCSRFSECVNNGMVSKVMCDTYVKEIERYGVDTMEMSEDIFDVDSEAVLKLIVFKESYIPRWHQAFLLVDDMINAFISKQEDRDKFTVQLANSYRREFGFESNTFTKQLNDKYRALRPQIEKFMLRKDDQSDVYAILEERKIKLSALALKISDSLGNNADITQNGLLGSYVHMCVNRLFRSKNRLNEMVIYDCLSRHYDSMSAREKYLSKEK